MNNTTSDQVCRDEDCRAGAEHADGLCGLHHSIRVLRVRCEAHKCKPWCTRGPCWRKAKNPTPRTV